MNDIISKMRNELRMILKASVEDYPTKPREKWLFDWPSQVILVVNQIFWCTEVEQAFKEMQRGDKDAMLKYNEFQVRDGGWAVGLWGHGSSRGGEVRCAQARLGKGRYRKHAVRAPTASLALQNGKVRVC